MTQESHDPSVSALLQWMHAQPSDTLSSQESFVSKKITVKHIPGAGRGLVATDKLPPQQIIKIPHSFLLNAHTVIRHVSHYNTATKLPESYSNIVLPPKINDSVAKLYALISYDEMAAMTSFRLVSMYLCLENARETSFWRPFLDSLPGLDAFALTPLVWRLKSAHWKAYWDCLPLQARNHAQKVYDRFNGDYTFVKEFVKKKDPAALVYLDQDVYLQMWMSINSRCLYMDLQESNDASDNFTLAPYVDFINHTDTDHCTLKIDARGFHVSTTCTYQVGDELYLSYGPHSNVFLLCEYGFALDSNRWNELDVSDVIIRQLTDEQARFLKENGYFGDYTVSSTDGSGISYRTEIALATMQEKRPMESRKLKVYVQGLSDGQSYQYGSQELLKAILQGESSRAQKQAAEADKLDDKRVRQCIVALHQDIQDIVASVLE